jgi:hypothetical protein
MWCADCRENRRCARPSAARQGDSDGRPASQLAIDRDRTAVCRGYAARDGEPKAGPLRLRRKERLAGADSYVPTYSGALILSRAAQAGVTDPDRAAILPS